MGDNEDRQPSGAAPGEMGRRGRGDRVLVRTVGIAMVVVVAVGGGVALAGRGGSHGPAGGTGQVQTPSAQAVVASAAPTATLAPEEDTPGPLTPDSQVRPNAMGPVTVGMTVEDAEGAAA